MAQFAGQIEVRRDSLLERLERVRPKILALIAPAGFGKSTLVRQLLHGKNGVAICDATDVADDLELARRLVPALAVESPERTHPLTQRELMLGDGGASVAERVNVAVEAWKASTDGTTFVFENAEFIAKCPSARELFARLLSQCPQGRSVVMCSRESLRVHLTRFAAPHEIVTLRAADLAFDVSEVSEIFAPYAVGPDTVARISALSQGWPIAVFLLKRFASEGRIEDLLQKLDDIAFEELHDYLADQVLSALDPQLVEALFACAVIPRAMPADLRLALSNDNTARALSAFVKESPFLTRAVDGQYMVHPLLVSLLLEHQDEKRNALLLRVANEYVKAGNYQRAAEMHLARGDQAAAAAALGQHEVIDDHTPSMAYARVLASLDRTLVQKYPRLWAVTAILRMFCTDTEELLDEAEAIWRTLHPSVSPLERYYVLIFRLIFMSYIGLIEEARILLEDFAQQYRIPAVPENALHGYVTHMRGATNARLGYLKSGERELKLALPHIKTMDVMASNTLLTLGADIARVRGETASARQYVERALEAARNSGLYNFVAFDLAEGTFGAWLDGDDELYARYAGELEETVDRYGVRGFAYFAAAARGRPLEPADADLLRWVVCGRLIAAGNAPDSSAGLRLAKSAVSAAEQYRSPFIETLALVAAAQFDEARYDEYLARAVACAARCESPALQSAVAAIAERRADAGMLASFMTRLQRKHTGHEVLEINLTSGTVRSRGRDVVLSDREFSLLAILALRRETAARSRIADTLWPELEEYAARNALSVCLHRLRQHLENDAAIVRSSEGYRLHDDVRVDLWEIDRIVNTLRSRPVLGSADRALLWTTYEQLRRQRPARMLAWEWFEPTERHICELRLEIAQRLAGDALSHGELRKALELAHQMIEYDPCDEPAREIAISAYMRSGDRDAAMRHYRQYRDTLQLELQCEPSDAIKNLVGLSGKTA